MNFRLECSEYAQNALFDDDYVNLQELPYYVSQAIETIRPYKKAITFFYGRPHRNLDGHHGIPHITRSLLLCESLNMLAEGQGVAVDHTVTHWALVLHDIMSNGQDVPDHGTLAASMLSPYVWNSPGLTHDQKSHILAAIHWHNKPHVQIPASVWTQEFLHITNADALDLLRMDDDREIVLTTPSAFALSPFASVLYAESMDKSAHDFEEIMQVASAISNRDIAQNKSL